MNTAYEIVDGQVHVWAPPSAQRPWAEGGESYAEGVDNLSSAERVPMSPEALLPEMDSVGVDRVVLVPPTFAGDDNDLALGGARRWPERFAVMGRLALDDPASRERLPRWREDPGMLGLRLTFHWGMQRAWLDDGTADWFWPAAEEAQLPVMLFVPHALDKVADIARRHPGLSLCVDHFGLPLEARDEAIPEVVAELVKLAELPNVAVKASALPSYTREPYPFTGLHEPIQRVWDAFGPRRVFWGSEMTRLRCPYREAVTLFTEELPFLSDEDLRWVMGQAISEWLGWPPPSATVEPGGRRSARS
jgi:predicted TIM-barrel fold metal-dependent hydrolase